MPYIRAALAILPAIGAWIALSFAYYHFGRREWQHTTGMTIVGIMLGFAALALVAPILGW